MTAPGSVAIPQSSKSADRKIRVLVVDDSPLACKLITETLEEAGDILVAGSATDGYSAYEKLATLKPDVITLDIQMPGMDGITFLKRLTGDTWVPAVVVSALTRTACRTALEALRAGAVEIIGKPLDHSGFLGFRGGLPAKVRAAFASRKRGRTEAPEPVRPFPRLRTPGIIAIGSSTGGTEAIELILRRMPVDCPGIVIAQHIPARFSLTFAERLRQVCAIEVKQAETGDLIRSGLALIAPGDQHLTVKRTARGMETIVSNGARVGFQRPSVDVLFRSVALSAAAKALGAILTGMGNDGTAGLLDMKKAGAVTIAQNEASCAVFGMPKEAIRAGAVDHVLSLDSIATALSNLHSSAGPRHGAMLR